MSSKPADESSESSSKIVNIVSACLNLDISQQETATFIVRKSAHYTEYFILSGLVTITYGAYFGKSKNSAAILLTCVLVALCDEFLQGFIPGRSSEVRDTLVDFSGALTFFVVNYVFNTLKVNKANVNKTKVI